jgi:hypothetical protein
MKKTIENINTLDFVYLVFFENFIILSQLLTKLQKKRFNLFFRKVKQLYTKGLSIKKYYVKRTYKFFSFRRNKRMEKVIKFASLYRLIALSLKAKKVGRYLIDMFSTQFVGKRAEKFIDLYLRYSLSMYKIWDENEKSGVFDFNLFEKSRVTIMRRFWVQKKSLKRMKKSLWSKIIDEVSGLGNFKKISKFGYSMRSLKITDNLFFWHVFTRKKFQQTFWLLRLKKFFKQFFAFKNLLSFKLNRRLNSKVLLGVGKASDLLLGIKMLDVWFVFYYNLFFFDASLANRFFKLSEVFYEQAGVTYIETSRVSKNDKLLLNFMFYLKIYTNLKSFKQSVEFYFNIFDGFKRMRMQGVCLGSFVEFSLLFLCCSRIFDMFLFTCNLLGLNQRSKIMKIFYKPLLLKNLTLCLMFAKYKFYFIFSKILCKFFCSTSNGSNFYVDLWKVKEKDFYFELVNNYIKVI